MSVTLETTAHPQLCPFPFKPGLGNLRNVNPLVAGEPQYPLRYLALSEEWLLVAALLVWCERVAFKTLPAAATLLEYRLRRRKLLWRTVAEPLLKWHIAPLVDDKRGKTCKNLPKGERPRWCARGRITSNRSILTLRPTLTTPVGTKPVPASIAKPRNVHTRDSGGSLASQRGQWTPQPCCAPTIKHK